MASNGERLSSSASPILSFNPTNGLVLPNIFYPVLEQLNKSGYKDVNSDLRTTLFKLEEIYPGFARYFLKSFIEKEAPSVSLATNMTELTLRLEQHCDKSDYLVSSRHEQEFQELNTRAQNLKRILSRIPYDIHEKREFLETIKEIASAIKKILDSVTSTYQYFRTSDGRQALESEKKEFVKYSKHFSNTLKAHFRDSRRDEVFKAANYLLVQTDYLLRTIKLYCETDTIDESLYPALAQHQNQLRLNASSRHTSSSQSQTSRQTSATSNIRSSSSSYETKYS